MLNVLRVWLALHWPSACPNAPQTNEQRIGIRIWQRAGVMSRRVAPTRPIFACFRASVHTRPASATYLPREFPLHGFAVFVRVPEMLHKLGAQAFPQTFVPVQRTPGKPTTVAWRGTMQKPELSARTEATHQNARKKGVPSAKRLSIRTSMLWARKVTYMNVTGDAPINLGYRQ